jgi:hypothetical protein
MNVITALKRLERAGSEDSRTTEKLRQAARLLSEHVVSQLTDNVIGECRLRREPDHDEPAPDRELPRGYALMKRYKADGSNYLVLANWREPAGWVPVDHDRQSALAFARDVANGWLDELAGWLEARAAEAASAAQTLEQAR